MAKASKTDDLPVHPLAASFPMMSDEAIAVLADSIAELGLLHPIMLGNWEQDGIEVEDGLVDGRNRLKACGIAKVEPRFERLNGHDATAYIVAVNLARRDLTAGQKAMLYAKAYPEPEPGKRTDLFRDERGSAMPAFATLSKARTVFKQRPNLVAGVIAGSVMLEAAYSEWLNERQQQSGQGAQMERLNIGAPDLAELVRASRMTLQAALDEMSKREGEQRSRLEAAARALTTIDGIAGSIVSLRTGLDEVPHLMPGNRKRTDLVNAVALTPERIETIEQAIQLLSEVIDGSYQ